MSGLRYETGRDMPPGMQEQFAVQVAQQLEETVAAAKQIVNQLIEGSTVAESAPMEFTCRSCGAGTNNTEQIGDIAVHFCDACRERISREVKWESQGETWRKPNVICPYCGYEIDSEDSALFFEVGETEEYACEWCQRKFDVKVREVRYYSTNRSACEMPEDWQPPEDAAHGSV